MEALIATINKLQDVFNAINVPSTIDLPQIVVIGAYVALCCMCRLADAHCAYSAAAASQSEFG